MNTTNANWQYVLQGEEQVISEAWNARQIMRKIQLPDVAADLGSEAIVKTVETYRAGSPFTFGQAVQRKIRQLICEFYRSKTQLGYTAREVAFDVLKTEDRSSNPVEEEIMARALLDDLRSAIEELPERYEQVIRMIFFEGKKQMDVAKALNVSDPSVSARKKAAIRILRKKLTALGW
jgi:RNA polymerase sigma factor (sigma-70 family)